MLLPASMVQLNDSVSSTVPDVQIQTVAGQKSANDLEVAVNETTCGGGETGTFFNKASAVQPSPVLLVSDKQTLFFCVEVYKL
jgi:hypothetical protein